MSQIRVKVKIKRSNVAYRLFNHSLIHIFLKYINQFKFLVFIVKYISNNDIIYVFQKVL